MEIIDITTISQLSEPEVDELLAQSINPRMPVEVLYAVLERIGDPAGSRDAVAVADSEV